MSEKIIKNILKWGSFLVFVSFFLIIEKLYFPYVTGKQLYFNILIEVLLWLWFYLILKYPQNRPRLSLVGWSLSIWLFVLLLSSLFGVDFNLSFWGDTERMLGWFSLAHFFAFYLILITVFKNKKDWLFLLNGSVLSAVILSVYAFLNYDGAKFQGNVNMTSNISTLGNATYVAGVMLFNFFFVFYLWTISKDYLLKAWYVLAQILILAGFFYADVSGSQVALVAGLFVFGLIVGILSKSKRTKIYSLASAGCLLLILILSLVFRQAPIFDNNRVGKVLREFSSSNVSLNARTFAWRAGWQGFLEKPVLGWGWGNFAMPFDKFFDAGLYNWTPNEEYYDRAHDMPIEMLATAGLLGLLAYLAIFVAIVTVLIRAWRQQKIKSSVLAIVMAVFVAYFIHNLAVFDSLANFVCLIISLALVDYLINQEATPKEIKSKFNLDSWAGVVILALVSLLTIFLIYSVNVKSIKMLSAGVEAIQAWYSGNSEKALDGYQKTFAYKSPLDRDLRQLFVGLTISTPQGLSRATSGQIETFLGSELAGSRANLEFNPLDYTTLIHHAQLLEVIGAVSRDENSFDEALSTTEKAIDFSKEHLAAYKVKANILVSLNKYDQAIEVLRQSLKIAPSYTKTYCSLAYLELKFGFSTQETDVWKNLDNCLDSGEIRILKPGDYLLKVVKHYETINDEVRLKKVQKIMSAE